MAPGRPRRTHKKYAGKLTTPMRPPPTLLTDPEGTEAEKWQAERAERLFALFEEYRIDPRSENVWRDLAFQLIDAHVPGLQIAYKPGDSARTTETFELVMTAIALEERDGLSTRQATKQAAAHAGLDLNEAMRSRTKEFRNNPIGRLLSGKTFGAIAPDVVRKAVLETLVDDLPSPEKKTRRGRPKKK